MDILIKEINGKDTIWYSDSYIQKQIENAYMVGLANGSRIEVHCVEPFDSEHSKKIAADIKTEILKTYSETVDRVIRK
jgi:hypothetical protein